jgi:putrescine transport system substrate-binding protein
VNEWDPDRDVANIWRFLQVTVVIVLLAGCSRSTSEDAPAATRAATEESVVNFANFVEEIAPEILPAFTRETGIRVNYDTYDLNQILESRLLVGSTGFDVVVPSNNYAERHIAAGLYQKLDKTKLLNSKHIDPLISKQLESNDPGNQYVVPYVWGTFGIGYNVEKVQSALGRPPPDSWALLFDPRNAAKLSRCGIVLIDAPWVLTSVALLYLGQDPNSERPEDLAAAMEALMAIRPYVREITSSTVTRHLTDGEACVAVSNNGDVYLARKLGREGVHSADIRYLIPKEGSILWIDVLAIPVDAPHPGNAHRLIDYLLRPDVIANVTDYTGFANANASAARLITAELRNDATVYPDAVAMQRLQMNKAHTDEFSRRQNRELTRFRTGK